MDAQVLFAGVAVLDLDAANAWYERLFDRPADIVPNDEEAMWRVTAEAGWLYLVIDRERAGRSLVAISVSDLDRVLVVLRSRGIEPETVEQVGHDARKATLRDPDGNTIALIEVAA
jgi:glyoxylase I family protein